MGALLPVPVAAAERLPAPALVQAASSAAAYALAELSPATRRAYASDFAAFTAWCRTVDQLPLPAAPVTVAAHLAWLADAGRKASTINRRTAAIAYRHRLAGYEPPTAAEAVRAVGRGIRNTIGTRVTRKAPATDKVLKAMLRHCPATLAGGRDRALLSLGFGAGLRRSELVALTVANLEFVPEGLLVQIRKSKTDQAGAGHTVAVPRGSKLRVVDAVEAWLAAAGLRDGPVFRAVNRGGHLAAEPLTGKSVSKLVKHYAEAAGFDPALYSGHSMRAGLVTTMLECGADVLKVMDVTRHTSVQTLKVYDRRAKAFVNHAGKGFL